jgi:hypothetical protein
LLDTGPLVSFLASGLKYHSWAVEQWKRFRPPLLATQAEQNDLRLMRRYRNRPMSLADAWLVRLSEIHATGEVVTLDSDFRIYRRHGNRVIPAVMPE